MDAAADIYSTWDFKSFSKVGNLKGFGTGDCPDFYPLPPVCDGCSRGRHEGATIAASSFDGSGVVVGGGAGSITPTHVRAGGFKGVYTLGQYAEGAANTTGNWTASTTAAAIPLDNNGPAAFYASKSMWDGQRRIMWGHGAQLLTLGAALDDELCLHACGVEASMRALQ
jgi:hypothetical protein